MRVEFEATLDEVVEVNMRALNRSRAARSWTRFDVLAGGLMAGLLAGALTFQKSGNSALSLVSGGVGSVVGAAIATVLNAATCQSRTRRYCRELLGGDGPYRVVVELLPDGLRVTQTGTTMTFGWPQVLDVREEGDDVEVQLRQAGLLVIRERAFESVEQMERFIDEMTRLRDAHSS